LTHCRVVDKIILISKYNFIFLGVFYMVNLNKLLMSVVLVATVAVKAEETKKSEATAQKSEIYTELKKMFTDATSQENIDDAKDCANKALEQTEKAFTQYPMYVPAAFFFGRASMAGKVAYRAKNRNMYVSLGLLAGHFYYNRNERSVQNEPVVILENNQATA
jgi:hypothetical protein